MGSLVCLPAQLACCCTSAACTLCSCCPNCGNSVTTRIMYGLLLFLATVVAAIMLAPGLEEFLEKVPFCSNSAYMPAAATLNCKEMAGYLSVYRIYFAMTLFFILMAVIMIGVKNSNDGRAGIQNGFWGIKLLVLIALCVGAFFIPEGSFGPTWMVFGLIGGFLFIIVQVYLIIDFAYAWAGNWSEKYQLTESKGWFAAMMLSTFGMYALSLTGIILLYVTYTKPDDCSLQKTFISINLILCVLSSAISILPKVQEHRPTSGLLQSAVVSVYVTFLTWSAVSSSPDKQCNPGLLGFINGGSQDVSLKRDNIVGIIIWILVVLYSSITTASSSAKFTNNLEDPEAEKAEGDKNDEGEAVQYNWSFSHFIFAIASLYIMMTLTNWYSPNSSLDTFSTNSSSMWVKITSSWLCLLIFNWWNVAPLMCPNRDFS